MTEEKILEILQRSKFWNDKYDNYDATTKEAKEELRSLGYRPGTSRSKTANKKILIGFNEPDYSSKIDWIAKEARWRPILVGLESLAEDEERKKAEIEDVEAEIKELETKIQGWQRSIENHQPNDYFSLERKKSILEACLQALEQKNRRLKNLKNN